MFVFHFTLAISFFLFDAKCLVACSFFFQLAKILSQLNFESLFLKRCCCHPSFLLLFENLNSHLRAWKNFWGIFQNSKTICNFGTLNWSCLRPEHMNEEGVKYLTAGEEPLGQHEQDATWIKLKWWEVELFFICFKGVGLTKCTVLCRWGSGEGSWATWQVSNTLLFNPHSQNC